MALPRLRFLPDPTDSDAVFVGDYLRKEAVGGAIALIAAAIAIVWANSSWGFDYESFREIDLGPLDLQHWAADGALSIFFFLAGLELKREFTVGSLSKPADAVVPVVAAACGVAVPALIYVLVNLSADEGRLGGWAIPSATDIAFALAVLAVVGSALPPQLRAFLLTLAVVDDLIVIAIIAFAYTSSISWAMLGLAAACCATYALMQRLHVSWFVAYLPLVVAAWWFTHESGIHATIAGVVLGLLSRPTEKLEHQLVPVSAGIAVPFFALMSAGVVIEGGGGLVTDPVVIGVVLGLVIGKPIGIFGGAWLLTRLTKAEIDDDVSWYDVFGISVLAGVGFTVSLLVAELSFGGDEAEAAKTAVLAGSTVAACLGALVLLSRNRWYRAGQAAP